jgi:hypothetical protein
MAKRPKSFGRMFVAESNEAAGRSIIDPAGELSG